MINDKTYKVIQEFFESFLNRYQTGLEMSMGNTDFIFDFFMRIV